MVRVKNNVLTLQLGMSELALIFISALGSAGATKFISKILDKKKEASELAGIESQTAESLTRSAKLLVEVMDSMQGKLLSRVSSLEGELAEIKGQLRLAIEERNESHKHRSHCEELLQKMQQQLDGLKAEKE